MEADLQSFVTFYLTGRKQAGRLDDMGPLKLRPAALAVASQAVRFADDHETDVIDLVTLILTRNQANPNAKDPAARRQAELIVSQTLAALKMLTERGQAEPPTGDAAVGAAPA